MSNNIAILGAGAWGTAIATLLANNGNNVTLWCYEQEVADDVNNNHLNTRYLPGVTLPPTINATNNLQIAIQSSQWLFEAVPVKALGSVFGQAKEWITPHQRLVILSKGIEAETLALPSSLIEQAIGKTISYAVLSGPNFAHELAQKVPTATTLASNEPMIKTELATLLNNRYFKVYPTKDTIGTQVCGALKNVMAIALGIAQGAGYQENTRAYLLTLALSELAHINIAFGGQAETAYGLAGLGDLMLCCTGSASRNFKIGQQLGQGTTLTTLSEQYPVLPEGIGTLQAMKGFAKQHKLNLPLCLGTYDFVFEGVSFENTLHQLISSHD